MELKPITIKTRAVGTTKPKERTYGAQILELDKATSFYITGVTSRKIETDGHFKVEDIVSVKYDDHVYVVTNTTTVGSKAKYLVLDTVMVA